MVEQNTEQAVVAENTTTPEVVEAAAAAPTPLFDDILKFVDEEARDSKTLAHFKGKKLEEALPQLVKNYVHAQQLTGKKVGLFSEDEIREFVDLPVKPKSADEYLTAVEDADLELVDRFKEAMYNMGLDTRQAAAFINLQKEAAVAAQEAQGMSLEERAEQADNVLHEKFGLHYRKAMDLVRQAAQTLGGDELVARVADAPVKDPVLIEALYKVGKELGSGTLAFKEVAVSAAPRDLKHERQKLLSDPDFRSAYLSATHPGHKAAKERMDALYE